ncbi:MAG: FHA domain-containing protein, partial [Aquabacterium sp.]
MPPSSYPAGQDMTTMRLDRSQVSLLQAMDDPLRSRACLVLVSGTANGGRWELDGAAIRLGRAPDCEICIDSPGISRRHAEVRSGDDGVTVHDLNSRNGTWLNERALQGAQALCEGDLVRVGEAVLRFHAQGSLDAVLHERLYRQATVDAGTGVHTRRFLMDSLDRAVHAARRSERPLSLLCLDLDHFKSVNDRVGHPAGDLV